MMMACEGGHTSVMRCLLSARAHTDKVEKVQLRRYNPNREATLAEETTLPGKNGKKLRVIEKINCSVPVLARAANLGHMSAVRLLCDCRADVNSRCPETSWVTPLSAAQMMGH